MVGRCVSAASVRQRDYALAIDFDEGWRFVTLTIKRRSVRPGDVALWELVTPGRLVVKPEVNGDITALAGEESGPPPLTLDEFASRVRAEPG